MLKANALGSVALTLLTVPAVSPVNAYPKIAEFSVGSHVPAHDTTESSVVPEVGFVCKPDKHDCTPTDAFNSVMDNKELKTISIFFDEHKNDKLETLTDPNFGFVSVVPKAQYDAALADGRFPIKTNNKKVDMSIGDPVVCTVKEVPVTSTVHHPAENPSRIPLSFLPVPFVWIRRRKQETSQQQDEAVIKPAEPTPQVTVATKTEAPAAVPSQRTITPRPTPELRHATYSGGSGYGYLPASPEPAKWNPINWYDRWPVATTTILAGLLATAAAFGAKAYHHASFKEIGCGTTVHKSANSWNPHLGYKACDANGNPIPKQPVVDELTLRFTGCKNIELDEPGLEGAAGNFLLNHMHVSTGWWRTPRLPAGQEALNEITQAAVNIHNQSLSANK